MSPTAWKLTRDMILVAVGTVMLLHEALFDVNPNALIVGAGLALLGIPPALRLDAQRNGADK